MVLASWRRKSAVWNSLQLMWMVMYSSIMSCCLILLIATSVPRIRFVKEIFVDFLSFLKGQTIPPNVGVGMELLKIVAIKTDDGLPIVSAEVSPPILNDVIVFWHSYFSLTMSPSSSVTQNPSVSTYSYSSSPTFLSNS